MCVEEAKTEALASHPLAILPDITPTSSRQAPPPYSNHAVLHQPAVMSSTAETIPIGRTQEKKEQAIDSQYGNQSPHKHNQRETDAAQVLQRTYRGHRERRQLAGLSLDPSTRWTEAIKEAQYRALTRPRPRSSDLAQGSEDGRASEARQTWRRVGGIARRAGGDAEDDHEEESSDGDVPKKMKLDKQKRSQSTQMMDLSYFLEMVDVNHRYGSNLRKYHAEWKRRGTRENFFYWLDQGEGKELSLEICPRERLDSMKVRYLSREERLNYLTTADEQGRLCWKKNGIRIDTSVKWKDSVMGIVPAESRIPTYSENAAAGPPGNPSSDSSSAPSSGDEASKADKKTTEVPPDAILNRLVRKASSKSKWIFVADTSFNLYVGIKQSGSFQHSSFLHGSRISSAGLIKIRDGRIKLLQPRSGHYRPPASNFLAFIHALRAKGVDMSAASVSASYAALIGIEGYMKGKTAIKEAKTGLKEMVSPKEKPEEHGKKAERAGTTTDLTHGQHIKKGENAVGAELEQGSKQQEKPESKRADTPPAHAPQNRSSKEERKHEGLKASLMRKLHLGERKS
ncbi:MAG: hypothetical protein HETSPECPRED_008646 [Heterodermia speciosa]|uniref:IQ domain-containing protein IQM6 n=1 Tax=Heterodermia speciosa TaxID=116794 RepID=A0A8H3IYS9_9LECA|nr:MAG: hypothetical protein HETSPECPRED_008646 [Heterodermia speciosa]